MKRKDTPPVVAIWVASVALLAPPVAAQTAPDRSAPPELGPPPALNLPPVERFNLSNGLPVILMEKRGVPVVEVDLVVKTGSVDDPDGKVGLASMTASMLDEGAADMDALQLADAIDFLGASVTPWAGVHASGVDLFTPVSRLDEALTLMAAVALEPTFPEAELERLRVERLTELLQARDEPRAIASVQFNTTLFRDGHPYGLWADEASLRAITAGDLRAFHDSNYHPDRSALIVVGDVTATHMQPLLEAAFGNWRPGASLTAQVETAPQVQGRTVYLVDKPGAAQSEIRIGRIGAPRVSDDYFPLIVMNTILGGSFTSRLNSNLREDKGYSYGAGSFFDMRSTAGPFVAGAAVQTDVTDKALVEFMLELTAIDEVSEEELGRARNYVALRFPGRFETVGGIASQLADGFEFDLPDDYFNDYVPSVLAVSKEDVERVARQYIDPDNIAIVVVGDREKIEAGIAALGLGRLELLDVEEVLGRAPDLADTQ